MKLSDWPSLRLVLSLAGGILISDTILNNGTPVHTLCVVSVPVFAATLILFLFCGRMPHLFGAGLLSCYFMLGVLLYCNYFRKVHVEWPDSAAVHCGRLVDWPQEKARSYRLDIELDDSSGYGRRIILYVPKDSTAVQASPGMQVCFYGAIRKPSNSADIGFDYAGYLYRHGISGTLWVPADRWLACGHSGNETDLRIRTMVLRRRMSDKLREWGLEGRSLAVVAAVSLGEKKALDDSIRQLYSDTGASHVLAVSGLHVGIVCWLLGVLLPAVIFPYRIRWLREVIIMSVLWGYAFAIGLPLSITRALVMFSMLAACRVSGRDSSSANALAFAALAILTVQPQGLFDIGFQLSFGAVAAILMFEPAIHSLLTPKTAVGGYFWSIVSVSLAAQLGTAPLTVYHFGTFSTWFLLANLTVLPLMFVTVCLSMLIWASGWFGASRVVTVWLLDGIIGLENGILERISALPHAVLECRADSGEAVWAMYALVLSVWLWLKEKDTRRLVQGLSAVTAISLFSLIRFFVV